MLRRASYLVVFSPPSLRRGSLCVYSSVFNEKFTTNTFLLFTHMLCGRSIDNVNDNVLIHPGGPVTDGGELSVLLHS